MPLLPRRWPLLALLLVPGLAPAADSVPPEVQFSLQHLKSEERARAAQALGPLEELPRYQVQLEVDPKARLVKGRLRVELFVRNRALEAVHLRVTPNAFASPVGLSDVKVNGQPTKLERPEDSLYRVPLESPVAPAAPWWWSSPWRPMCPARRRAPTRCWARSAARVGQGTMAPSPPWMTS